MTAIQLIKSLIGQIMELLADGTVSEEDETKILKCIVDLGKMMAHYRARTICYEEFLKERNLYDVAKLYMKYYYSAMLEQEWPKDAGEQLGI